MSSKEGVVGVTMSDDREWLLKKAEQEDGCMVSVGGLVSDLTRITELESEIERLRVALENIGAELQYYEGKSSDNPIARKIREIAREALRK